MNQMIETALNTLYLRQITTRDQLIREALRVALTKEATAGSPDIDELFLNMKSATETKLGHFPADREDFYAIYSSLSAIDLFEFVSAVCENDREGLSATPEQLTSYVCQQITLCSPESVLIADAEKCFNGLDTFIAAAKGAVTLTTQNLLFFQLLLFLYSDNDRVSVQMVSIYAPLPEPEQYDYIFCLPVFGGKLPLEESLFLTRDYDSVALENLLSLLSEDGTLDFIAPAKITFASGGYEKLRQKITDDFAVGQLMILPEGTFRPWTAIKTYFLSVSKKRGNAVQVGELSLHGKTLKPSKIKELAAAEFSGHADWRIELLLSDDDENLHRFRQSSTPKVKLREIAEVFRGKSILKKDTSIGDIGVLNISDMDAGEVAYDHMDTISEEKRKVKRYELQDGDVLLSCRGTAAKTAVFTQQDFPIIASANIIVLRLKPGYVPGFVRLFLESPVGSVMLQSFQRGSGLMNLSPADIMEMELPDLPEPEQEHIAQDYKAENDRYRAAIAKAEKRMAEIKTQLFERMI